MAADIITLPNQTVIPRNDFILRDIRNMINQRGDCRALQAHAIRLFVAINGFKMRGMRKYGFDKLKICDHAIYLGGALIGQPYVNAVGTDWREFCNEIAAHHGLAFHVPPHPTASFHLPGDCLFLVFTKPGHPIAWLPEQITGIYGST